MVQGPIVDSAAGLVYAFVTSDGSSGCTGGMDCTVIYEVSTSFAANIIPVSPEKIVPLDPAQLMERRRTVCTLALLIVPTKAL